MEATHPVSTNVSDYLGMFRRHWWVVLILTAAGVGAASAVTRAMPAVYESSTSVLVQPAGQDTNVVGGRTKGDINLDTEAQLVRSTAVAAGAAELLRSSTPPDTLARDVVVEVPPNTSVLVITYAAGNARQAQAGSHAFAEAYLRNREASARAQLDARIAALNHKIQQINSSLSKINSRLARTNSDSPDRPNLESLRQTSINQVNNLSGDLNELTTMTVSAGKIISDARLPGAPSKPDRTLNLATGVMVGLLFGFAVAGMRERFDRRIRRAVEVTRRTGVPVLAELTARTAPRFDDVLPPYGPGGRIFNRLRNEVLAGLGPDAKVLVVTGASPGPTATLVAANLASALARTGNDVVLVGAHLPETMAESASLAKLLGVAATPGLSDIVAGRLEIDEVAQRAPRLPYLRVIPTGGTATAAGLMQSHALRDTLDALRTEAEYVVVEAPSTATSADAQSLASLADAAILTVELKRTARPQVVDAAEQLRRVGTPLLGAIVLPRLPSRRPSASPAPGRPAIPLGPDGLPRSGGTGALKTGNTGGLRQTGGAGKPGQGKSGQGKPGQGPGKSAGAGRPSGTAGRPERAAGSRQPGRMAGGPSGRPSVNLRWDGSDTHAADVTTPLPRLTMPGREDPSLAETAVLRRVEPQQPGEPPTDRTGGGIDGAGR